MTDRSRPTATYRLQLTGDFGFAAAAGIADYLARLGVSHVYLSPVLQAVPGSQHGYDVIDHDRISADLGGETGFTTMVRAFRDHHLGVIVDIVPNHMAVPAPETLNRQLWSVLEDGQRSRYARWFDVDWAALDGKFLLPVLAGPVADCLAELVVADGLLHYRDHVFPIRPGTAHLPLPDLLAAQHYLLAGWHEASTTLNWRRFFDITTLIGLRQEDPEVFAATHATLLRLFGAGLIDGFRVDHPDGLADPRGYVRRLRDATGGRAWIVTEKILARDEELPRDWPCAGTTGYDALALVDRLFTDPAGAGPLSRCHREFTGATAGSFAEVAGGAKREIAELSFGTELTRLTGLAQSTGLFPQHSAELRTVLTELLAGFDVYRAYVQPGEAPPEASVRAMESAAAHARPRLPEPLRPALDRLTALLLGAGPAELVVRFQQLTGPVMAKGVEDTAGYRWSRLVGLNEVGGDPDQVAITAARFHRAAARLAARWPGTMTTLSTHDTKRQEDVRAMLATLTERPQEWAAAVMDWHQLAPSPPDTETEYFIWQTLAGGWPSWAVQPARLPGYLTKAIREAKTHTSWTDPDSRYEATVLRFAEAVLTDRALRAALTRFSELIAADARVNSLGAKLVQLTMPGVPDVYQGCELAGFAFTDPDNRRPVDFSYRRKLLAVTSEGRFTTDLDAEKLLVTTQALRTRRDHPDWFRGGYHPLPAQGAAAEHVVAFAREAAITVVTRLPAGLRQRGGWSDTVLEPGPGPWRDQLTGRTVRRPIRLGALLRDYPVALLIPQAPR